MPSPTLHKQSDDKWHGALCANFVHEYKQYLQTLGFIPIQTEPASPRKGWVQMECCFMSILNLLVSDGQSNGQQGIY